MKRIVVLLLATAMLMACCPQPTTPDVMTGRILRAADYDRLAPYDLNRTDMYTGAVDLPVRAGHFYLVPDGQYWRLNSMWPPEEGACTFDIHDDTWERISAGGDLLFDRDEEAWTDGETYYRLAGDGYGSLHLVIIGSR